jgi:pilus assembly protein CpaE
VRVVPQAAPPLQEFARKPIALAELVLRVKALMVRAGDELVEIPVVSARPARIRGQATAVFSLKGGVGKSTIATNTAVGLALYYPQRVLLVDADLWGGDIATLLNVTSDRSVADICWRGITEIESLQRMLAKHPSGVEILQRPPDLQNVEQLNIAPFVQSLSTFLDSFDHVIVNLSSSLDEMNLQILDLADRILMVTTPEIAAIANTSRFMHVARQVSYADKVMPVVNRANSGISIGVIEEALEMPISQTIVSNGRLAVETANAGTSVFLHDPHGRHQMTRDLLRLVERIAGRPSTTSKAKAPVLPFFGKRAARARKTG